MSNQGQSKTGKGCCLACGGCAGLLLIVIIGVGIAMYVAVKPYVAKFEGIYKITNHFQELQNSGQTMKDLSGIVYSDYGDQFEESLPIAFATRESDDDEWEIYIFEVSAGEYDLENLEQMENNDDPAVVFVELRDLLMALEVIPRTQDALDLHEELGLELPDDFDLDELEISADIDELPDYTGDFQMEYDSDKYDGGYSGDRPDRDEDDHGSDRDRDRDRTDDPDDSGDSGNSDDRGEKPSR